MQSEGPVWMPVWMRLREGGVELAVRLNPRASREGVQGLHGDRIKLAVHAAPVAGAANEALVHLVAEAAGTPPRQVRVVVGARSRSKTVLVASSDPEGTARRILGRLGRRPH